MKKIALAVLAVLFISPAAMADNWGAGVKLGIGENDPKTMKDIYDQATMFDRELTKSPGYFSLEALYEWNLNDEANKIGAKIGWDMYGENELKLKGLGNSTKITEETYSLPITVYYKRDNGVKNFSWFAGAGITILHTKIEFDAEDESKTKAFPHIAIGGEYRFTKLFALGLDARYNIGAKVKKDGDVLSDRSGFGAAITGRFYF